MYNVTFRTGDHIMSYSPESSSVSKWMASQGTVLAGHILSAGKFLDIDIERDTKKDLDKSRQLSSCVGQVLDLVQAQRRGAESLVISITVADGERRISIVKTITDNMSWYEMPSMTLFLMENL